jgi:hypothetical protein
MIKHNKTRPQKHDTIFSQKNNNKKKVLNDTSATFTSEKIC